MEPIHQSPNVDKLEPREGVGVDTLQLRLDLTGQPLDTWRVPPPVYGSRRSWRRPASHAGADWRLLHLWIKGLSVAVRLWSTDELEGTIVGGACYIRCEVSRLAACDAEPDRGPWPNSAKVTPDDARDLLATLLLCLEHAVGGDVYGLPCEVTRIDVCADARVRDVRAAVAACSSPPIVPGRATIEPTRYGSTGITHPRTVGRLLEGGKRSPRTEATRVYSREHKPGARAADAGIVRFECEHGTGAHGSAARPGPDGQVSEALSLETALDPATWTAILEARLAEHGLTPGVRAAGDDVTAFANALIAAGIRPDQASFYAMISSGRLNVSDRTARATRKRVESRTDLRWGAAAEESFPQKVFALIETAKQNLQKTNLAAANFRPNLAQILALDPDHCAAAQTRPEPEPASIGHMQEIDRRIADLLCEDDLETDTPTRCLLPAPRGEPEGEDEEGLEEDKVDTIADDASDHPSQV